MRFLMTFLTALAVLLILSTARAADWPQWRGPNRDGRIQAQTEWPDSLAADHLSQAWSVPLGPGYSGPVVSGKKVFVTETRDESHEVVRALDRSTGDELWKVEWKGATTVPFFASANGSWIRSTPATDGTLLFVAGIRDLLVCLDVESGKEVWRLDFTSRFKTSVPSFGTVCSPLPDGDFLYIQAAASVVKLNKTNGEVIWRSTPDAGGLLGSMQTSAFSSPVIATVAGTRQLIVQSRSALQGLDLRTGKQLWSVDVEAFRGMNILTPMVCGDQIFTSTYGGGSFLFEVTRTGKVFRVSERWKTSQQGYMSSPVAVGNDLLLHLRNQRFTRVDLKSGDVKWTSKPFGKYWSMVANGNQVLALDQRGELRLIDAAAADYKELDMRKLTAKETWAHLAVADQQVFVRDLNGLTVWSWK